MHKVGLLGFLIIVSLLIVVFPTSTSLGVDYESISLQQTSDVELFPKVVPWATICSSDSLVCLPYQLTVSDLPAAWALEAQAAADMWATAVPVLQYRESNIDESARNLIPTGIDDFLLGQAIGSVRLAPGEIRIVPESSIAPYRLSSEIFALGIPFVDPDHQEQAIAGLIILRDELPYYLKWKSEPGFGFHQIDMRTLIAHELGHIFGICGHDMNPDCSNDGVAINSEAVMYSFEDDKSVLIRGLKRKRLHTDDIAVMNAIYSSLSTATSTPTPTLIEGQNDEQLPTITVSPSYSRLTTTPIPTNTSEPNTALQIFSVVDRWEYVAGNSGCLGDAEPDTLEFLKDGLFAARTSWNTAFGGEYELLDDSRIQFSLPPTATGGGGPALCDYEVYPQMFTLIGPYGERSQYVRYKVIPADEIHMYISGQWNQVMYEDVPCLDGFKLTFPVNLLIGEDGTFRAFGSYGGAIFGEYHVSSDALLFTNPTNPPPTAIPSPTPTSSGILNEVFGELFGPTEVQPAHELSVDAQCKVEMLTLGRLVLQGEGAAPVVFQRAMWANQATEILAAQATSQMQIVEESHARATAEAEVVEDIVALTSEEVLISAGEFAMGFPDDSSQHTVTLGDFFIDKFEVTNARYRACVEAGVCTLPDEGNQHTRETYYENPKFVDSPVVLVSWYQASEFCEWDGKRLPTEAEWEKAARGTLDNRIFPWGEERANCTRANLYLASSETCVGHPARVGSYEEGISPYGVYEMAGNVREWVADYYDGHYYSSSPQQNPQGPQDGESRVIRGGSWAMSDVRSTTRWQLHPNQEYEDLGFRCARTP